MGNSLAPDVKKIVPKAKLRKQIHISSVNMLNDCGVRFEFRYVRGIRRPPNAFMHVGTAIDQSVTNDLDHKIETGELLKRSDVLDIAAETLNKVQEKEPIELEDEEKKEGLSIEQVLGEAKDKTVALAGLHHDEAAPGIEATQTRRRFSVNMDAFMRMKAKELYAQVDQMNDPYASRVLSDRARALNAYAREGVDFVGEQDIFEKREGFITIRDTKSSIKSPSKSIMDGGTQPGTADDSEQLTAYAVASHVVDGKLPDLMVLDYLVRTKAKEPTLKYVPTQTTRTMADVDVFLNRFVNAIHALKTGVFVPANQSWWGCAAKWCGYYSICPYAKQPKLVQITKEVPK